MKRFFMLWLLFVAVPAAPLLYAAQSTITEAEGYSCMGIDKSRKQTEQEAMADASAPLNIRVRTRGEDIGIRTRGFKIAGKPAGWSSAAAEFVEVSERLTTRKK